MYLTFVFMSKWTLYLNLNGSETSFNKRQCLNASLPIKSTDGKTAIFNEMHPSKVNFPIDLTDVGRMILSKLSQYLKEADLIDVSDLERNTFLKDEHL